MKRLFIKSWPYLTTLAAGMLLFLVAVTLTEDYKGLLINISATLLAIPLLFLIYELAKDFSSRKLNKELFDYAKMQIDREALSIVMHLIKIVQPYAKQDKSQYGIQSLLNKSKEDIEAHLNRESFLGFQVLKQWTITEGNLTKILESPFIIQRLENAQVSAIIMLLKSVQRLEDLHRSIPDLYVIEDSKDEQYVINSGSQINERNTTYHDRHLLFKRLGKDRFQVLDFGDFTPYELPKLLNLAKVKSDKVALLTEAIFDVIVAINTWVDTTGDNFIVDSRMFRATALS